MMPATDRAGVDADADLKASDTSTCTAREHLEHADGEQRGDRLGVVVARFGQPGGRHVGVADRLDLLDAEADGDSESNSEKMRSSLSTSRAGDISAAAVAA